MQIWKNKKLLILGATKLLGEIVKQAQRGGAYVIAVDYLENSFAKKIADESYLISTTDVERLTALIIEQRIDGIITGFMDSMLPYYLEICRRTNLPCYINQEQIDFSTDKAIFKRKCALYDIKTVKDYTNLNIVQYPVLVKPTDSSGSKGITVCHTEQELTKGIEVALENSQSKNFLIEQFLDLEEATAFYLFVDGVAHLIAMADRHMMRIKDGLIKLPTGYTFPSRYLCNFEQELHPKLEKCFKDLKITNGIMFLQCFVTAEGKVIPYEPGFRLTGTLEYQIIETVCGFNPLKMMINFALTGKMSESSIDAMVQPYFKEKAYNISCLTRPGKISLIQGDNEIANSEYVAATFCSYQQGDLIDDEVWGKLAQIIYRVLVCGGENNYNEVVKLIHQNLRVQSSDGEDMLINKEIEFGL